MAKLNNYSGSIDLITGLRQKNNGDFPLLTAHDVQVDENGKRLDTKLEELAKTEGGGTSITITDISESTESGGSNVVTFSNGKTLSVKNGKDGKDGLRGTQIFVTDGANSDWLFETTVVFTFADIPENQLQIGDLVFCKTKWFEVIEIVANGYYSQLIVDTKGSDGKSAYQYAKEGGYKGTEAQFSALLANSVDKRNITLGIHTDGLMYVFVDGVPVGNGVALPSGAVGDIIGTLDENNNVILSGDLADGTYTLKYENADGTYTELGTLQVGELSVVSISATKTKTSYTVGDTLTTNDITVTAKYSDGSTKTITDYDVNSSAVNMGTAGTYNLVVSFGGASANISITVVAAGPAYENKFVENGDGYILNGRCGSDGTDRTGSTGNIVTNYIACKQGDVIRVKGLEARTGGSTYSGIYRADKSAIKGFYVTTDYSDCITNISRVPDGHECSFTIAHADAGFIRLCGGAASGDPNKVIITVNQEIV